MSKVQEYLRKKKIQEMELPKMYFVKSNREGVDKPVELQVSEIIKNSSFRIIGFGDKIPYTKYKFDESPYEIEILSGETSAIDKGLCCGIGDSWVWNHFCSLSKNEAEKYYKNEKTRIEKKYKNKEK